MDVKDNNEVINMMLAMEYIPSIHDEKINIEQYTKIPLSKLSILGVGFSNLSEDEKAKLNESYQKLNALGRIGDPLEAAKAVKWLLSDDASFVTGQNIIVDGGIGFRFE